MFDLWIKVLNLARSICNLLIRNDAHQIFFHFQCYYLGGLEESATGILGEMSKPLSWSMPADKICEKLKKKDVQICDLKYGKVVIQQPSSVR